jgi:hypothetical protein
VAQLLAERPAMVQALGERFPGCLAVYLTQEDDGSWLDVVFWRSRAESEEAARLVSSVRACATWVRAYRQIRRAKSRRSRQRMAGPPAISATWHPPASGKGALQIYLI